MTTPLKTKAIASWFGSNRTLAPEVGKLLEGCKYVAIPFCGGMSELRCITARSIVCNDLHKNLMNLLTVMADPIRGPKLYRHLRRLKCHPQVLEQSQECCRNYEKYGSTEPETYVAAAYFICSWMGYNGRSGTKDEFNGKISVRYDSGGGDSATRVRSAVNSIPAFRRLLARCTFTCLDAFVFLDKCSDRPDSGIYCDPPFIGPGAAYKHQLGPAGEDPEVGQRRLAERLAQFKAARVVCRFYDVELIRELYPADKWTWHHFEGRKSSNAIGPEVLLVNRATEKTLF